MEWRLIFALARWGGLRIPSELMQLRWQDVDWAGSKLRITSPKTEHHEGKGSRVIPLFRELREHLEAAWDAAPEGAEFVIATHRDSNANLRTQFERIIGKAGVEPWPKLFQNLRSSRETELAQTHPLHVCASWLGNSPAVAVNFYMQVTESDFAKETSVSVTVAQNCAQSATETARNGSHEQRTIQAEGYLNPTACNDLRTDSTACDSAVNCLVPPVGLAAVAESPVNSSVLSTSSKNAGTELCTLPASAKIAARDADLQRLIAAWPTLSASIKAAVLVLIEGDGESPEGRTTLTTKTR